MADRYITDLPAATSIQDTDALLVDQSNAARMITGALLKDYINRNILTVTVNAVASTAPARVVSYNAQTGALVIEIPRGYGIKSMVLDHSSGLVDYYNIITDDDEVCATVQLTNGQDGTGTVNSVDGVAQTVGTTDVDLKAVRFTGANPNNIYNPVSDLNNFLNGIAFFTSSVSNYPTTLTSGAMVVAGGYGNGTVVQMAVGIGGFAVTRRKVSGSWSVWKLLSNTKTVSINLSTTWTEAQVTGGTVYLQSVTIAGGTSASKVDLQPTEEQILALIDDGVTGLLIENNSGSFTAVAIDSAPTTAMTIQATITEVAT